ncbi:MAG: N-acyl homoserine lactonase family protein, partial [Candidatus Electrothrix sp. EH2]|nr:N-acyl homoserine lactonase family protein [Candidatus Electrothrix sp. EH2]
GKTAITGFCVIRENFEPPVQVRAMEMEVIPPGTSTDTYAAYNLMLKVQEMADYIIPLHEPEFAAMERI